MFDLSDLFYLIGQNLILEIISVNHCTATVESVLLYGCESWTLASRLEKRLDGCYTRMLHCVKQIHWEYMYMSQTWNSMVD